MAKRARSGSGFTLVEVLVSIGVIGVLITLALPAVGMARASARQTVALANARTVATTMHDWADRSGHWPFVKPGERLPGVPRQPPPGVIVVPWWPKGTFIGIDGVWAMAFLWPGVVSEIAPWEENYATWMSPGLPNELPEDPFAALPDGSGEQDLGVSFRYSNSFVAQPALWQSGATPDEKLISATTITDVRFPSQKALVWDDDLAYLTNVPRRVNGHWEAPTPVGFVDLHAALHDPSQATPGVANPLNAGDTTSLHNTPEGVFGRDF